MKKNMASVAKLSVKRAIRFAFCRHLCADSPFRQGKPWLIRKIGNNYSNWNKGDGDASDMAKKTFEDGEDRKVSVYIVGSDTEEAIVLSALALGSQSASKPAYGLRLSIDELTLVGIELDKAEGGTTGIPDVDRLHADLKGSEATFEALTREILTRQRSGRDHVRCLHDKQLLHQWTRLNSMSDTLQARAQKRLKLVLDKIQNAAI